MNSKTGPHIVMPGGAILNTETGQVIGGVNVDELTPHDAAMVADVICRALNDHLSDLNRKGMQ